jgi:hypothetical protein
VVGLELPDVNGQLLEQTLPAPWAGEDSTSSDNQMPVNKARRVLNYLPGSNGRVKLRGPITRPTALDSSSPGAAVVWSGGWAYDDKILLADMNAATVWYSVTDWSPTVPTLSTKVSPLAGALNIGLYPFHARAGDFVYGYTAGSVSGAPSSTLSPNRRTANGSAVDTDTNMVYWTGGSTAADFFRYGNTSPRGSRDVKFFLNRLWVLGGSVPGTVSPVYPTRLYYSIDLGTGTTALPDAATSWQTGGVTNQIALEGSSNDYGVATAILNGRLVILRRNSIYMMTGSSPTNFQIRRIAGVGCLDPGSVMEWDDGIFFLSDMGYVFFDGATTRVVSGPINNDFWWSIWQGAKVYELSATRISSEHIMLTTTADGIGSFFVTPVTWIYHVPTGSWSRFRPALGTATNNWAFRVMRTANYPLMFEGNYLFDTSFVAVPEVSAAVTQAGADSQPPAYGGVAQYIDGEIWYRVSRLGTPESHGRLQGVWMEFALKSQPGNSTGTNTMVLSVYDPSNDVDLSTSLQGPSAFTEYSGADTLRARGHKQRQYVPSTIEKDEIQVRLRNAGGAGTSHPAFAEIYDTTIIYMPAGPNRR